MQRNVSEAATNRSKKLKFLCPASRPNDFFLSLQRILSPLEFLPESLALLVLYDDDTIL